MSGVPALASSTVAEPCSARNSSRPAFTDHTTYCPYKGDAAYYSIPAAGGQGANAVWTYEAPYEAVSSITDRLAFYPNRVDAIEEQPL